MKLADIYYIAPFIPLITRLLLCLKFKKFMREILSEEEKARGEHRSLILSMAGFSFSGVLALVVIDNAIRLDFHFAIYYLMLSFIFYFIALNLQGYKNFRWQDQAGTALMDVASLSLILAIISIMMKSYNKLYMGLAIFAFSVWLIDHGIRLRLIYKYLEHKGDEVMSEKNQKKGIIDGKRDLDWVICPIHNIPYPKGGKCPKC